MLISATAASKGKNSYLNGLLRSRVGGEALRAATEVGWAGNSPFVACLET